jgi:hypothetical protein
MAATWTINITLSPENEYSQFIDVCNPVGAYILTAKSELPEGCHAIFAISSANDGQKSVKKLSSVAGSNGEQLHIVWPEDHSPVLCYLSNHHAPQEERHYNIKVI